MALGQLRDPDDLPIIEGTHDARAEPESFRLKENVLPHVAGLYHGIPHAPFPILGGASAVLCCDDQVHGRAPHPHLPQSGFCQFPC